MSPQMLVLVIVKPEPGFCNYYMCDATISICPIELYVCVGFGAAGRVVNKRVRRDRGSHHQNKTKKYTPHTNTQNRTYIHAHN